MGKPIFIVESPYRKVAIAPLSGNQQTAVVSQLSRLTLPIAEHRSRIAKSKGKFGKKRKRAAAASEKAAVIDRNIKSVGEEPPALSKHILAGFNVVTTHLECLAGVSGRKHNLESSASGDDDVKHLSAVFLARPPDDTMYAHFPLLCHTASLAHPDLPATRLVLLDKTSERAMAVMLGLARVSVLAIVEGAPGAEALVEYVREHVQDAEVPWLQDAKDAKWKETGVRVT